MEIKLIKEFNTINQGYNSQEGGENPPILKDEDNFNCTHSNEIIDKIIYDLKYTDLSFLEIANIEKIVRKYRDSEGNIPIEKRQKIMASLYRKGYDKNNILRVLDN